jgi:hypothetical protein
MVTITITKCDICGEECSGAIPIKRDYQYGMPDGRETLYYYVDLCNKCEHLQGGRKYLMSLSPEDGRNWYRQHVLCKDR